MENLQWVTSKENNFLGVRRKSLRDAIQAIMKEDKALSGEVIKKKLAEEFEDSDIFSFDEQFEIAYRKTSEYLKNE